MGATYVDVTIRNPADPHRSWTGRFPVDTGAFDSLVPREHLEGIGLQPRGRRGYVLADGKPATLDITIAEIEFEGKWSAAPSCTAKRGANRCSALPPWSPRDSKSIRATKC